MKLEKALKLLNKNWLVFLLLFLIGAVCYANVLKGPFLIDDNALIVSNEHIKSFKFFGEWFSSGAMEGSGHTTNLYRPLATLINAITFKFFGLNTAAFHTVNILLHILNSFLVFTLFKRLNFIKLGSLLAAIIFLVHPVQAESVSYIAGLPDVLSATFILSGLIAFLRPTTLRTYILLSLFTILSLLSKEIKKLKSLAVLLTILHLALLVRQLPMQFFF